MKRTKPKHKKQYTVRSVPEDVDRQLRERAKKEGKSLNEIVLAALALAAGHGNGKIVYHDLDEFIGTWVEDPAFDEAIAAQDQIDEELWR